MVLMLELYALHNPPGKRTVDGIPAENSTCKETPLDFIHPDIIERHPAWRWALLPARFRGLPEIRSIDVLQEADGVPAKFTAHAITPDVQRGS